MEAVTLSRVEPDVAASLLRGAERFDPRGIATQADVEVMCQEGACFAATHASGAQAVYVLRVRNGQAWVDAAAGSGQVDLTALLLPVIELQAARLSSVAFQTARPGLVRKAQRAGYRVAGWILKKDVR